MGSPGAPLDPERIPPDRGPGPPDRPSPLPRPGSPGSPIEASYPPPGSYGGRRCPCHRRALRRPNSGALSRRDCPGPSDPACRNADRESSAGAPGDHPGGCKRALERTVLLKGGLQPPLGRRDHEAPRPQDGTGSTRSASGCVRPATSAGSRTRRTRAGACGRWRGQPGGWRRSTQPRGGGHRETARGLQTSPRKNVLYKGGLQPPPGGPGPKAVLERPGSPIPCDEGEDLLKGSLARGISGESGGLRSASSFKTTADRSVPTPNLPGRAGRWRWCCPTAWMPSRHSGSRDGRS